MQTKRKPIPGFKSEVEERAFWESHDSSDYVDWGKGNRAWLPNLEPTLPSDISSLYPVKPGIKP